jgi:hypothetical protein
MSETEAGCQGFEADLSALLDRELGPQREAELRAHVDACPGCRARLAGLARVDLALSAAELPTVPASLRARLEARIASAGRGEMGPPPMRRAGPSRRAWRRAAGALAAAAAVAALYLAVATREPARPEKAPAPPQIARPLEAAPLEAPAQTAREAPAPTPREAPQVVAKLPPPAPPPPAAGKVAAPALPAPAPVPAPPAAELDLATVPEDELGLALEMETVEDLDVIGNLELLELVLASEAG